MLERCYNKAIEVLRENSTKNGLFASGGIKGYNAIWARDSVISFLGASLVKHQSKTGQVPNAVDKYSDRKPHVDFKTIDSTLWYIIGHYIYKQRYKDSSLLKKYKPSIDKALFWLRCQDAGEVGMLAQLPTSDWQDAFPHKYGYTINTQALYHKVLTLTNNKKEANKLRERVNKDKDDKLWFKNFYVPYRWKNHNKYKEMGTWFDSLGNNLAILFDIADKNKAKKIISYIKEKKINKPIPMKVIYPPIRKNSEFWKDYFLDSDAGKPYHYANAGIWTFVGCFYILSLIKIKKSYGSLQSWEAGMYILAYRSLMDKKVLL